MQQKTKDENQTQTNKKSSLPVLSSKHPVPFPADSRYYHNHTISRGLFKKQCCAGQVIFMGLMETSDVLICPKWVVWGLELNFQGILQRFQKCCITNISDGREERVPGTAVWEDVTFRYRCSLRESRVLEVVNCAD